LARVIEPPALPQPHDNANPIIPTSEQIPVFYVSIIFIVFIMALWHLPGARVLLNPFKLLTIGCHEMFHVFAALITGGEILSVTIDPNLGGCTRVQGGHPPTILFAGYLGSTLFGAGIMLAGFDILAAKITSFVIALVLLAPVVLVRDRLTLILTAVYETLLIGFWFIDHGSALRWYSLFVGIMNVFYALWDFIDDHYFKKTNDSDASQFALMYPKTKAHWWATGWVIFEVAMFVGFMLVGLVIFHRTQTEMYAEAATFLPT